MPTTKEPPGRKDLYGTGEANDEPSLTHEDRRKRCYELACHALIFGSAPADAKLVHGTIDGGYVDGPGRIGHAWLRLADGRIWEPISAKVYGQEWMVWADALPERVYTRHEARLAVVRFEHYGRWHESPYP